jgi:hypothetical protein
VRILRLYGDIKAVEINREKRKAKMNLVFWFAAMFLLGLVVMGVCYLFMKGCEKI